MAVSVVYSLLDFSQPTDTAIAWQGQFVIENSGKLNAMRFITKNILAVVPERSNTIDWLNHYMTLPLPVPMNVVAGDIIDVSFAYRAGGSIPSLQASIVTARVEEPVRAMAISATSATPATSAAFA
jgi:protein arginine N-methyltransferase 1